MRQEWIKICIEKLQNFLFLKKLDTIQNIKIILWKGKECQSVHRLETKCILITGADTPVGIELVREMCKRGAERVIMACNDVVLGQDVAVEICGETNEDIIAEHCDMSW